VQEMRLQKVRLFVGKRSKLWQTVILTFRHLRAREASI
jgi:hypothetical protein